MQHYVAKPQPQFRIFLYIGGTLFLLGLILLCFSGIIVTELSYKLLSLHDGSGVYQSWQKTSVPTYLEIFIYNWTNPEDGHKADVKPKFKEIGPFTFKEVKEKVKIKWNDNSTVSYRQTKTWWFDQSKSCCPLDTKVTSLNPVLVSMSHKVRDYSAPARIGINLLLRALSPDLQVTTTFEELMFEGFEDQLIGAKGLINGLSEKPNNKFAWYLNKNTSDAFDGFFNMDITGVNRGAIKYWNYADQTTLYPSECNQVTGSAGELYPPGQTKTSATFFSPDMCRTVTLDYADEVDVHGVTGYKYIAYNTLMDNGTFNPSTKCFCNGECFPMGLVNVSACKGGAPSFVSMPHFLHADPYYINKLDGVSAPDKEKHQLYIVLEPVTGITLEAAARVQFNLHLKPISY